MSSANSSSNTGQYETAWVKALRYLNDLPPEQDRYFKLLNPVEQDMLRKGTSPDEILQLLQTTAETKPSKLQRFTDKVAKPFMQFQGLFEATASLVISVADEAGKIQGFLKDLLENLKHFSKIENHFRSCGSGSWDHLHTALADFYIDVINFTLITAKYYRGSTSKHVFQRIGKSFDDDFGGVISDMKRHWDSIPLVVQLAAIKESDRHHEEMLAMVQGKTKLNAASRPDEQKRAVCMWLSATGMEADQQRHHSNQLPGTGDWFFDNSVFCNWLESDLSGCLCVLGIAGCGKSVLSSTLIHRLKSGPVRVPVLYFFCKEGDEKRNNASSILRTLIFQLLNHADGLVDVIYGLTSNGISVGDYSIPDLWNILKKMLDLVPVVYLIIDALDECNKKDGQLLDVVKRLATLPVSNAKGIKIFATCRPNQFKISWPTVVIGESDVAGDLKIYIADRVEKLQMLTLEIQKTEVCLAIEKGAGGTFLWASLMLDTLKNSSPWEISQVVKDIPEGLSDVYDLMLHRVSDLGTGSVKRCQRVLYWCVVARRLLTVDELLMALAISEGVPSQKDYDMGSNRAASLERLRHDCGSLISIRPDNCVQLVHTSLQEYLLRDKSQQKLPSPTVTNIDLKEVHTELAGICIRYNQSFCFEGDIPVDKSTLAELEKKYPFSRYSSLNWISHISNSGDSYSNLSVKVVKFLSSKQASLWLKRCDDFDLSGGDLLQLQGQLKAWRNLTGNTNDHDAELVDGFILRLRNDYYNSCEGNGRMDAAHCLGCAYSDHAQYKDALKWYQSALRGKNTVLGTNHASSLETVSKIASVYEFQGWYKEAQEWNTQALDGQTEALGKDHLSRLETVSNLARLYFSQGQYKESLMSYKEAFNGQQAALGKDHPTTLTTVSNIGGVYCEQGKYDDAMVWFSRALAGTEASFGKDHPHTLIMVACIGRVHSEQHQYVDALVCFDRALVGAEEVLGKNYPSTLAIVCNIGDLYYDQLQYDVALGWYKRALDGMEVAHGMNHPKTLLAVSRIGVVYFQQDNYVDALTCHNRALAGQEVALRENHPSTLATLCNLGMVYFQRSEYNDALRFYKRALAGQKLNPGENHPSTLATVCKIGDVYFEEEMYPEALGCYMEGFNGQRLNPGKDHPSTLCKIGDVYFREGKYGDALGWYMQALDGQKLDPGEDHLITLVTVRNIGDVYRRQRKYSDALKWYRQGLPRMKAVLSKDHRLTLSVVERIIDVEGEIHSRSLDSL